MPTPERRRALGGDGAPRRSRSRRRRPSSPGRRVDLPVAVVVGAVRRRRACRRCGSRRRRGRGAARPRPASSWPPGAARPSCAPAAGGAGARRARACSARPRRRSARPCRTAWRRARRASAFHVRRALQPLAEQRARGPRSSGPCRRRAPRERLDALRLARARVNDDLARRRRRRAGARPRPRAGRSSRRRRRSARRAPISPSRIFTPEANATATWPSAGTATESPAAACAAELETSNTASVRSGRRRAGSMPPTRTAAPAKVHQENPCEAGYQHPVHHGSPAARLTRRGLVGAALATGAAASLPETRAGRAAERTRTTRRRRRHRRRVRRPDRRPQRSPQPAARWSCSRRATAIGGRALNLALPGGAVTERGATFAGPTQDHILALARERRRRHLPHLRHRRQRLPQPGPAPDVPEQRPDRHRAAGPDDPRRADRRRRAAGRACRPKVPVDAPWTAAKRRRVRRPDARDVDQGAQRDRALPPARPRRHPPGLRRRAARAVAAVRALLHRRLGQRDQPRHVRAQLQHQRRRADVPLRGRRGADRGAAWRSSSAAACVLSTRPRAGSRRAPNGVARRVADRLDRRAPSARSSPSRRRSPAGSTTQPPLPAARDQLTQRLGQGTLTKVTAVYDTPFWRAKGLTGTSVSADGLVNATFDDSPENGTPASCSASSAATAPAPTSA